MSSRYGDLLLRQSRGKSLLLDSNLLLLLLIGSFDPSLVHSFKRLRVYHSSDLFILQQLSKRFPLATCPHILTEVSNLANSLPEATKRRVFPFLGSRFAALRESQLPASDLVKEKEFAPFGLTDAALSLLCQTHLLMTTDERLASHLRTIRRLKVLTLRDLARESS